ncbi:hypothetical protein STEG23_006324 [Scotinomys teguina]
MSPSLSTVLRPGGRVWEQLGLENSGGAHETEKLVPNMPTNREDGVQILVEEILPDEDMKTRKEQDLTPDSKRCFRLRVCIKTTAWLWATSSSSHCPAFLAIAKSEPFIDID